MFSYIWGAGHVPGAWARALKSRDYSPSSQLKSLATFGNTLTIGSACLALYLQGFRVWIGSIGLQ